MVSECPTGVSGRRSWILEVSECPTVVLGQRPRNPESYESTIERLRRSEGGNNEKENENGLANKRQVQSLGVGGRQRTDTTPGTGQT